MAYLDSIRVYIERRQPRRAVVVGGGYIGLDVLPAELVNIGIGLIPNIGLARDAGLDTNRGRLTDELDGLVVRVPESQY